MKQRRSHELDNFRQKSPLIEDASSIKQDRAKEKNPAHTDRENAQNSIAATISDNARSYEMVRAALLSLALVDGENSKRIFDEVLLLMSLPDSVTGLAAGRNALLALDSLIQISCSVADAEDTAEILASRLGESGDRLMKATADKILFEYLGARAASANRIASFYKEPDYLDILRDFQRRHKDPRPEIIRELLQAVDSAPEHICDIGCGTADLGLEIAQLIQAPNPLYITRLDINPLIVNAVSGGQQSHSLHVTNHCADFLKTWPVSDHSQDIVVLAEVLEHSFDPQWLLREARRVLRGNGLVVISIPNAWHWKKVFRFLFHQRLERTFVSDHIQHFSKRTLRELLRSEGFDIHEIRHFSLHWETPVLFDWEPAKSAERWLHRLYSQMPGCAWNYLAVGQLRHTIGNRYEIDVRVGGVMAFGKELLRISEVPAVRQAMSEGKDLIIRALEQSKSLNLNSTRTIEYALLRILKHLITVCGDVRYTTVESWLNSIDKLGWSKRLLSLWKINGKPDDGAANSEWDLVAREASQVWG